MMKKALSIAEKKGWAMGFSDENKPDKVWLIKFLSKFTPDDPIFHKSYVAPPIRKKNEEEKVHKLPKSLFEDMPVKRPGKRVRRMKLSMFKEGRKKQRDIRSRRMKEEIIGEY